MRHLALLAALAATLPSPVTAQGPAAARGLVQRYYAAIERGDFAAAYRSWSEGGQASGKSLDAFARGFAGTAHTRVVTGLPRNPEGAAGSTFITVPVDVRATLKSGRRQHFRGVYVLRRVNDVPASSAVQRQWHIASARLSPVR